MESEVVSMPITTRHPGDYLLVDLRGQAWSWQGDTWKAATSETLVTAARVLHDLEVNRGQ